MAARSRFGTRVKHFLEAASAVVLFGGILRLMPIAMASAIGGFVARTIGPYLKISRIARDNLRQAFPDKSPDDLSQILAGVWDNLGRTVVETPRLKSLVDPTLVSQIHNLGIQERRDIAQASNPPVFRGDRHEVIGLEHLIRVTSGGDPVIFYGAHMGNWEFGPASSALIGFPFTSVVQPPHNPYIAHLLARQRGYFNDSVPSSGWRGAAGAANVLRSGRYLGMMVDQKVIHGGLPLPFFGRPAITSQAPARLALHFGCPLIGVYVVRVAGTRFRFVITPAIKPPVAGTKDQKVVAILRQMNREIESWVRDAPDQWLWLHRRWHAVES